MWIAPNIMILTDDLGVMGHQLVRFILGNNHHYETWLCHLVDANCVGQSLTIQLYFADAHRWYKATVSVEG